MPGGQSASWAGRERDQVREKQASCMGPVDMVRTSAFTGNKRKSSREFGPRKDIIQPFLLSACSVRFYFIFFFNIYLFLFIWLWQVLDATYRGLQSSFFGMQALSCGMWDLVPWPESQPRPPALGAWSLSHWTTREVCIRFCFKCFICNPHNYLMK